MSHEINDFLEHVKCCHWQYFIPHHKLRYHASLLEAFLPRTAENNSNPNGQKSNQLSFSHSRITSQSTLSFENNLSIYSLSSLLEAFLPRTAENNSNPNGQKSNQLSFSHSRITSQSTLSSERF